MTYETKTIPYTSNKETRGLQVKIIPDSKGRLVFDRDRDFYYYHVKDGIWIKVNHGIYRLLRIFSNMLYTYFYMELPQIKKIEQDCDDIHVEYLDPNKDGGKISTTLGGIASTLARVRDEDKVAGRKQVAFCSQLASLDPNTDTDEITIGVLRAHTAKAIAYFKSRLSTIDRIQPRVLFLYMRIERMIEQVEERNQRALHYLCQILELTENDSGQQNKALLKEFLRKTQIKIHETNIKPFTRTRERILVEIQEAQTYLDKNKWNDLVRVVKKMINSLKLKAVRGPLERIMVDLSLGIRRRELFTASRQEKVRNLLKKINTGDLIEIDETGFEIPVADRVAGYLQQAYMLLEHKKLTKEDLNKAKGYIDKAIGLI